MNKTKRKLLRSAEVMSYAVRHSHKLCKLIRQVLLYESAAKRAAKLNLRQIKIEMLLRNPPEPCENILLDTRSNIDINKAFPIAFVVRYINPKNVFEFGTYRGSTTLTIENNIPQKATIYTLDIGREEVKKYADEMFASDFDLATIDDSRIGGHFKDYHGKNKIIQLLGDSYYFDFSQYENKMDFIYIDGSHAYKYVKKDTANAFKMLSDTGIIMWDDVFWSDVMRCLSEFRKTYPIYYLDNGHTAIYYQKNKIPQTI